MVPSNKYSSQPKNSHWKFVLDLIVCICKIMQLSMAYQSKLLL